MPSSRSPHNRQQWLIIVILLDDGQDAVLLEELVEEEPALLSPLGIHPDVAAPVSMGNVDGLAVGVAFSLVAAVEKPLATELVDDAELVELRVR